MTYSPHPIGPSRATFRSEAGSDNLALSPDTWHRFGAPKADEVYSCGGLILTLSGAGILANLNRLGQGAALEIAIHEADRFGIAQDRSLSTFVSVESAEDWRRGTHEGTVVEMDVDRSVEGTPRPVLTGIARRSPPAPNSAIWISHPIALRYGDTVERVVWEVDMLRDQRGSALEQMRLELQVGITQADGSVSWPQNWTVLDPTATRGRTFDPPLSGQSLRWRVGLTYHDAADAAFDPDALRTQKVFMLGAWVLLSDPWWRFATMARLLQVSESDPVLRPAMQPGDPDLAILRLPLPAELRGRHGEHIAARLTGNVTGLDAVHIEAVADLELAPRPSDRL